MIQTIFKIPIDNKDILIFLAILGFLGASLANLKSIYDLFDIFSRRKLSILKESLNDGKVTEPIKEVLQEQVDLILFGHATGIKDYNNLRKQIIELYDFANGRLTYLDFKRAYSFLRHKADGSLEVRKIGYLDRIFQFIMWIVFIFCFFISALSMFILLFYPVQGSTKIILLLFTFYCLYIALVTLVQTQSFPIAQKIKHEIRQKARKEFLENQDGYQLSSAHSSYESNNITEESQLDLINDLWVLKPATETTNLTHIESAVKDMREERINKFTSW